ncbi:MAG: branched-chain amino acid transport system permease protein [Nocardioidaceae bacterium]|nr:branched-chain amino acid transport system permease protein [Nocardioidaceae bacterium]
MSETATAPELLPPGDGGSSARAPRDRFVQRLPIVAALAVALLAPLALTSEYVDITGQALIAVIGAVGLNLLTGYTGQLSLGHAGLFAMSGFVTGVLSYSMGVPFPLNILAGMVAGAAIGLILGLPALRLRGLYLVLATVAFHFIAVYLVTAYQSSRSGFVAISGITLDQPKLGPLVIDSVTKWYYLLLAIAVLVVLFARNLVRTRPGRAWVAVRHGELVASALGVNVLRSKLSAFVVSSVMAALAGGLLVQYAGSVAAESYPFELAVAYLVMIIVGGLGSITGAIIGAFIVTMAPEVITTVLTTLNASSTFQTNYLIPLQVVIYGLLLVAFLLFEPSGLVGIGRRVRRAINRRSRA